LSSNNYNEVDNILYLGQKLDSFKNAPHLYELTDLVCFNGTYILIYPFEPGEKVDVITEEEWIGFLSEIWSRKIICRSITKENNFIRVNGVIKLIDYEIEPYSDNLYLNMLARAFIQLPEIENKGLNYNKLKRSVINNLKLDQIAGFYDFTEKVFMHTAVKYFPSTVESKFINCRQSHPEDVINQENTSNKISLLIKSCIQDAPYLYKSVRHIIKQLSAEKFIERVLLLDVYKQDDFLRQYNNLGTRELLTEVAGQLLSEGYIENNNRSGKL
jgi:hypothetical protein